MKRKKWAKELKFKLVLEGLQGDTPILHSKFGQSSFTENCCQYIQDSK